MTDLKGIKATGHAKAKSGFCAPKKIKLKKPGKSIA